MRYADFSHCVLSRVGSKQASGYKLVPGLLVTYYRQQGSLAASFDILFSLAQSSNYPHAYLAAVSSEKNSRSSKTQNTAAPKAIPNRLPAYPRTSSFLPAPLSLLFLASHLDLGCNSHQSCPTLRVSDHHIHLIYRFRNFPFSSYRVYSIASLSEFRPTSISHSSLSVCSPVDDRVSASITLST
jgi:hypothetical protein